MADHASAPMLKFFAYLILIPTGSAAGLIVSVVLTQAFFSGIRDYYVPIYFFLISAIMLVPTGGCLGGYGAQMFAEALKRERMAVPPPHRYGHGTNRTRFNA
jgi:hypothetical protein